MSEGGKASRQDENAGAASLWKPVTPPLPPRGPPEQAAFTTVAAPEPALEITLAVAPPLADDGVSWTAPAPRGVTDRFKPWGLRADIVRFLWNGQGPTSFTAVSESRVGPASCSVAWPSRRGIAGEDLPDSTNGQTTVFFAHLVLFQTHREGLR